MAWIPMVVGAALGAAKDMEGRAQAASERKRQAEMTRYSPWTGQMGKSVQDPSLMGDIATGAAMGAQANTMMKNGQVAPQDANSSWLKMQQQEIPNPSQAMQQPQNQYSLQGPWAKPYSLYGNN